MKYGKSVLCSTSTSGGGVLALSFWVESDWKRNHAIAGHIQSVSVFAEVWFFRDTLEASLHRGK